MIFKVEKKGAVDKKVPPKGMCKTCKTGVMQKTILPGWWMCMLCGNSEKRS